jgi:UMF1 family MFS transporter
MGVQTIILLASLFGEKEVKMESTELIVVIIIVQVIAILGAWLFAKISNWKNTKISVMIALVLWFFLCFRAYFVVEKWSFFALAGLLGLVMGGIQSQSRSFYSKLLPDNHTDTASFFSFYDILEKFAIVIGTFSYGTVENLTGSLRNSILAMSIFFVISFVFLSLIKTRIKL